MTSRKFFTLKVKKSEVPHQHQQPSSVKENDAIEESTSVPDSQSLHKQSEETNSLYSVLLDGLETSSAPSLPGSTLVDDFSTPPSSSSSTNYHSSSSQLWSPLPQPDISLLTRQCLLPLCDVYKTRKEKSGHQKSNETINSRQDSSKSSQLKQPTKTTNGSKSSEPIPESHSISTTTSCQASKSPATDIIDLSEDNNDMEFDMLCMEVDLNECNSNNHANGESVPSSQSQIQQQHSTETNCSTQTAASSSAVSSRNRTTKLSSFISEVQGKKDTVASQNSSSLQAPKSKKRKTLHDDRKETQMFTCSSCEFSFPPGTTKQQYTAHVEQCLSLDDVIFID